MTFGQSSSPWRPLGKTDVHFWLVQRMSKVCGVDTARAANDGDLESESWAEMINECRSCQWVDGCQRWLDRHNDEDHARPPNACVNAGRLKQLAERQGS